MTLPRYAILAIIVALLIAPPAAAQQPSRELPPSNGRCYDMPERDTDGLRSYRWRDQENFGRLWRE
jgi:hypothetical protein